MVVMCIDDSVFGDRNMEHRLHSLRYGEKYEAIEERSYGEMLYIVGKGGYYRRRFKVIEEKSSENLNITW